MIEEFDVTTHAFLFDVDGTLIDIAPTPQAVVVPAALRRNLGHLNTLAADAVALVSGRPLRDLDRLFAPLELTAIGGHGAEIRRHYHGGIEQLGVPPIEESLRQKLAQIASVSDNVLLEDKGYSIAIHYRLAPDLESSIIAAVTALCAQAPEKEFEVLHGKCVVEVKRAGIDKGTGIRTLMQHPPFRGRRPIYIGDDITDEHAFAVLPEFNGIAISVGRAIPGAAHRFDTPDEVRQWIAAICRRHPLSN